jgi:Na+-translocating ferredoxin:NAD+ oxidoreductase RNF subunit RnfB
MGATRACATVCPTGAITVDNKGSTVIDQEKCISCGKCMLACHYGAIIDKSYIFQLIQSFKSGGEVYALLCPGLHEQFQAGSEEAAPAVEETDRKPCGAAAVTDADGNVSDYVDLWTANAATKAGDTIVLLENVTLEEDQTLALEGKTLDLNGMTLTVKAAGIDLKDAVVKNGSIRFAGSETATAVEVPNVLKRDEKASTIYFDSDAITEAFRLLGFTDAYELKEVGDGLLADCQYNMWRSTQTMAHRICEISNLAAINKEIRLAVAALKQESPDCKVALISACTRSKLVFEREKGLHVDYVLDYEELMGMMDARGVSNDAITLKVGDKDKQALKILG